jgi:putative hydrolase of the HAD superfamily
MFEDLPRNLLVPKALGMKTILLMPRDENHEFADAWEKRTDEDRHIDYTTSDLAGFLNAIL